jgi:hypothetical protein
LGQTFLSNEITNIEQLGFWVLVDDKEYFVPFADYPVFLGASIQQIFKCGDYPPPSCTGRIWTPISSLQPWKNLSIIH